MPEEKILSTPTLVILFFIILAATGNVALALGILMFIVVPIYFWLLVTF